MALIVIGLLETTLHHDEDEPTHPKTGPILKIIGGVLALAIIPVVSQVGPETFLAALCFIVLLQMAYNAFICFAHEVAPEAI